MKIGMIIAVLAYELATIIGIGWWLSRRETKAEHNAEGGFTLGGRSLPVGVVAATMALTVLGTAHILGVFEMSWYMGAAAVWFSIAHVLLLVVVCLSTGLWVRRLGVTTVPELLEDLFGKGTRLLVSCVMAGVIFGILTVETQGLGIIIAAMTGWSIEHGAIAGGLIGILYVVIAGMKEVGWINLFNAAVMYVGLILSTIFLALRLPGSDFHSVENYYATSGNGFMLSIFGNADIMITFALGTVIAVVFSQSINQMLLQAAMSAKSEMTIKKALWIAAPVNGLFGVFAVVIGLTAKSIPEFNALGPKVAATSMLVNYLPPWLAALLLASFLAAVLSTFAMTSLSPATIFSMDIYKNLYKPDASEDEIRRVTRIAITVLAVIAIGVASFLPPILAAMNWLFAWLIPVFWVVIFGILWKRSTNAAVITLIVTWILNSAWSFTPIATYLGVAELPNSYLALGASLLIGVPANLLLPGKVGYFRSKKYRQRRDSAEAAKQLSNAAA